jgi:hypothetical protein
MRPRPWPRMPVRSLLRLLPSESRAPLAAAASVLTLLLAAPPARASSPACPAIQVKVEGKATQESLDLPLTNYPIAVRMEVKSEGLPTLTWEAVVTDGEGHFAWVKEFPADPCHEGFFGKIGGAIWGWTAKARSRAYHHRAQALPRRITLNAGPRLIPIEREELLDKLDDETHTITIDVDLKL